MRFCNQITQHFFLLTNRILPNGWQSIFSLALILFVFATVSFAQIDSSTPSASPTPTVSPTPETVSIPIDSAIPSVSPVATVLPNPEVSPTPIDLPTPEVSPTPKVSTTKNKSSISSLERNFFSNIAKDQYAIWTSPFRIKGEDAKWLAPLGATTFALIATDRRTTNALNDNDETRLRISRNISQFGAGYTVPGMAVTFYFVGKLTKNKRATETGILATQAYINTQIVTQALKYTTQRPRPLFNNGNGKFFTGGNSFPSGHSSTIWSLAAVIDGQYGKKRPIVRIGVYSLATAVSLSRYTGQKHFLSDVLVGGAIGWGIGHYVFIKHHDKALDSLDEITKTTKFEKYFPLISPNYNAHNGTYGAGLTWKF